MDTPKLTHGRDYEALIGIAMDMGTYAVTGSLPPLGRIFSTSACGRGMTCTDTSSPMRRAAAAPASVAAFTAPTSPRTIIGHVASTDVFLADQHNVGRLHHRVGCLDRSDETFGLDHSQGFEWHAGGTLTDGVWVMSNDV